MADSNDPTPTTEPAVVVEPTPETLGDPGKKALTEERAAKRAAEKRASDLEARLKEYETRDMSEAEKSAARLRELEQANNAASSEVARLRVALRYQISDEDIDLLGTGTEEQIDARAKRIAALRTPEPVEAPPSPYNARPVESLRPGATPAALPLNGDPLLRDLKAKLGIS